ncbi:hypothetical protein CH1034_250112 [Klebsiella pneumoniae]|nr:hypothetical protein CH1034_250112 [Klebsiella pneumoniae]
MVHKVMLPSCSVEIECEEKVKIKKALSAGKILLIKYHIILYKDNLAFCIIKSYPLSLRGE